MQRITVLLGAGAMIEATGVSTSYISKAIFSKGSIKGNKSSGAGDKDGVVTLKRTILKKMYELQSHAKYEGRWSPEKIAEVVNFEEYFNVLELMYSYCVSLDNPLSAKEYVSPHRVFTTLSDEFKNFCCDQVKIYGVGSKCGASATKHTLTTLITHLLSEEILIINEIVNNYDKEFAAKGKQYQKFFTTLQDNLNCRFDIYNLNYDAWPEYALPNYNDGYVAESGYDFLRFKPETFLTIDDRNRVANLHGQIFFEEANYKVKDINRHAFDEPDNVLYKYKSFSEAQRIRDYSSRSNHRSQQRESLYPANIITGLMKSDKLLQNPFDVYQMALFNSLLSNRKLIIIGYGFGDYYLNSMLNTYLQVHKDDKKVLLIDKKKEDKWEEIRIGAGDNTLSESDMLVFMARAFGRDGWFHEKYSEFMYSDNNDSCFSTVGFKKAAANDRLRKIKKFLM